MRTRLQVCALATLISLTNIDFAAAQSSPDPTFSAHTLTLVSDREPLWVLDPRGSFPLPLTGVFFEQLRISPGPGRWARVDPARLRAAAQADGDTLRLHYVHRDDDRELGVWLIIVSSAAFVASSAVRAVAQTEGSPLNPAVAVPIGVGLGVLSLLGFGFGFYYTFLGDRVEIERVAPTVMATP